jgi:hypothetical protein
MLVKAHFSPRRLGRLGWPGIRRLPEVARAYRLYNKLDGAPLPDMLERMTTASSRPPCDPVDLAVVVDWFLHPMYKGDRCMPRTCILLRMLKRRGYDAAAVFGVSKGDTDLDGHAWIELEGEPLAEHTEPREKYRETFRHQAGAVSVNQ